MFIVFILSSEILHFFFFFHFKIKTIVLEIGTEGRLTVLYWIGAGGDAVAPPPTAQTIWPKRKPEINMGCIDWRSVTVKPVTK